MSAAVRFVGQIAGLGSSSGMRLVVGMWHESPFGPFGDVMIQQADGHRILLAPTAAVGEFVTETYRFDEVCIGPVRVHGDSTHRVVTGPGLDLTFEMGRRPPVGLALVALPRRLSTWPVWLSVINPLAKLILPGVQTAGSAGGRRREFYGAYDVHTIVSASGTWRGKDVGSLAPVKPPVTFGFGSTPTAPAVTSIVTTIRSDPGGARAQAKSPWPM
ncbi:MAG: hypothetical protein QOF35_1221 [Actinomycetota bacterium]|jgi:hypothetical protein|nr:hypothetical protein [Actinomycetota bacterium]